MAQIIEKARQHVSKTVDVTMCVTYYEIGKMIVDEEQGGRARAKYGYKLLAVLSEYLSERFKKGFSETNLKNARKFYIVYARDFNQSVSIDLNKTNKSSIRQKASAKLENDNNRQVLESTIKENDEHVVSLQNHALHNESLPFKLGWSQYQILMRIKNDDERRFYEFEAIKHQWSVPELKRQFHSSLYERLALSRDKDEILRLATVGQSIQKPRDILKSP